MTKAYRHKPLAPDEYLGWVNENGSVFDAQSGTDLLIGHVDLNDGKIYKTRLRPDKYYGRVDLENGKVFLARLNADEYIGKVHKNGRCYQESGSGRGHYLGKVKEMASFGHGGAAFILLIFPRAEMSREAEKKDIPEQVPGRNIAAAPNNMEGG